MAFAPSASWNLRSITHLGNYLRRSLPTNSSDESFFQTSASVINQNARPLAHSELQTASELHQTRSTSLGAEQAMLAADDARLSGYSDIVLRREEIGMVEQV